MITTISSGENTEPNIRAISSLVAGVNSEGLIMARLPAASTPARGVKVRLTGKFHGLMTPTTPLGWKRTSHLAPNRPRIAGVVGRFSAFIHFWTWALACLRVEIDEATSVKAEASFERAPKSVFRASSISTRWSTNRPMQRSIRSIRWAAVGAPSLR